MGSLLVVAIEIGIAYGAVALISNEQYFWGSVLGWCLYKLLDVNRCECSRR